LQLPPAHPLQEPVLLLPDFMEQPPLLHDPHPIFRFLTFFYLVFFLRRPKIGQIDFHFR
jgi:hypothetical protein